MPLWSWHHARGRQEGLLHIVLQQAGDKCSSLALGRMLSPSQRLLTWLDLPEASRTPDHQQHSWHSAILGLEKAAGSLFLRSALNLQHLQDPSRSKSPKNSVGKVTGQPYNSSSRASSTTIQQNGLPKITPRPDPCPKATLGFPKPACRSSDAAEAVPKAELDARAMV